VKEEKTGSQEKKTVSFRKLIEALEKEGLRVCDIHLEETENPDCKAFKQLTGSVVIKTFPENSLILVG
jgi:hypothetical protein